jgi:nitrogen-specific signal transduction histidine kinase
MIPEKTVTSTEELATLAREVHSSLSDLAGLANFLARMIDHTSGESKRAFALIGREQERIIRLAVNRHFTKSPALSAFIMDVRKDADCDDGPSVVPQIHDSPP